MVSTAAFHVRGSVPGLGGLKETKNVSSSSTCESQYCGELPWPRKVACSTSDRQGSNFKSCVWRTVSSQSSHHPQEVLLAQLSLYVHKGGLKPDSFHFLTSSVSASALAFTCGHDNLASFLCILLKFILHAANNQLDNKRIVLKCWHCDCQHFALHEYFPLNSDCYRNISIWTNISHLSINETKRKITGTLSKSTCTSISMPYHLGIQK